MQNLALLVFHVLKKWQQQQELSLCVPFLRKQACH